MRLDVVPVEVVSTFHNGFVRKFKFQEGLNFRKCRDCSRDCECGYPYRNSKIVCPPGWSCSVLGERYDGSVVFELSPVGGVKHE